MVKTSLSPFRICKHSLGFLFPLAALFGLAVALLFFTRPGLDENFSNVTLLKCGLLIGTPEKASCSPSLELWASAADPLLRGVLLYHSREDRTALPFFEQVYALHPSDPIASFWLARAAYRSGDTQRAILVWRTLGARQMALFFNARSKEALKGGETASALEPARIAAAVDPGCGQAHLQLGQVYYERGSLEESGRAFLKALGLDLSAGDRGEAYHALAEIDRSLGHDQQALDEYRLAVEFTPTVYIFLRDLADQYARLHQDQEARMLLDDLLAGSPRDASVLVRIGNLSLAHSQYGEAERWYQAAVSADPDSGAGEAALGRLYRQKGELRRAAAFFRRSSELNPDNLWVFSSLGGIYWQQGQLDQAITQYEWVVSQSKNKQLLEDAWLSLAQLYTLTEKVHQAHSAWEYALKINPANAGAQKAMR